MSVLSWKQQRDVLAALVDGNSERAVEHMTEVSRPTISRFALMMGERAQWLHNRLARDLSCSIIENDEVWSYVKKKQARVTEAENAAGLGEAYTFTALAMPSRFVVTWMVGKRDEVTAEAFIADLRARLVVMPAMTSDGFPAYPAPIGKHFGPSIDYGMTIKNYRSGARKDDDHRYEPPRDPFITKKAIYGAPDLDRATTSHIERNNGTMRHKIGRMRRLCYAFSKSPEHHKAAVALGYVHYNLVHTLRTTRITPAMGVGVAKGPWSVEELLEALLAAEPCDPPAEQPLAHRVPAETSRELPNGRGFLRALPGGKGAPSATKPETPTPAPLAPVAAAPAPASLAPTDDRQLNLLEWRPKPRPTGQLSLFGDEE